MLVCVIVCETENYNQRHWVIGELCVRLHYAHTHADEYSGGQRDPGCSVEWRVGTPDQDAPDHR